MSTHTFTAILNRPPTDGEQDALFEAGLDDSAVEVGNGTGLLHVDREAATLDDAILSVVRDVERAGFEVTGLKQDDLVPLKTIAERCGRSYESLRLLAAGKRGPGGFPAPLSGEGWSLYSWTAVSTWLGDNFGFPSDVEEYSRTIAAADLMARARLLIAGRPSARRLPEIFGIGSTRVFVSDDVTEQGPESQVS
ncbi:hypothetical protein [Leifsonia aquatica]|uniref:hypothetical protein n=1 Tax=Leifsonia aquatica TaxID=144185 RepID=UPI0038126CF6